MDFFPHWAKQINTEKRELNTNITAKLKVTTEQAMKALVCSGKSTLRPGRFTSSRDLVPIVKEAGLAPGSVWTWVKNFFPTGI
jgi:hypothetical protein